MSSHSVAIAQLSINQEKPVNPCGFYVLVELVEVEDKTASGIYLGKQDKEQSAEELGYLRAIGPTAFLGWEGCKDDDPAKAWGISVGDLIEFRKFEGKKCAVPGFENWRYIPDSHIVGVVNHE